MPTTLQPGSGLRRLLATLTVTLIVLLPGTPAWAHAQLVSSDPARDATLAVAPGAVTLTFNERLSPDFTTIVVSDAARRRVPAAAPAITAGTGTLSLAGPLGNGTYTVAYRVVSVDGHTVQGSYAFTVADPARQGAVPASSGPAAAPAAGSGGIPASVLIGLAAFAVLCALVTAYLVGSGRRRAR